MGADNKNKDNIMVYKKYSDIIWMTIIPAPGPKKKSATHMRKVLEVSHTPCLMKFRIHMFLTFI